MIRLLLIASTAFFVACSGGDGTTPNNGDPNNLTPNNQTSGSCAGCTLPGSGECVNGDSPGACGIGGMACAVCPSGFCTELGECVEAPECGPETCDGCCDESGLCVAGEAQDECGVGGFACEDCATTATCESGTCVPECGPDTCSGCCNLAGQCVPGNTDSLCGRSGGSCADCATITSVCSEGVCVAPDCAENCNGCCSGSDCIVVATANQCGAMGNACVACGAGRSCVDGGCVVDPDGDWTITFTSGVVVATTSEDESWDGFMGLPDPFVRVEVGGDFADTSVDLDTLAPAWNDDVLTVTAEELFGGMRLQYLDDDVALNDIICEIEVDFDAMSVAFDGGVVTTTCPDQPTNLMRWKLTAR